MSIPGIAGIITLAYSYFEQPWVLLLIIPAIIVLAVLINKTLIHLKEEKEEIVKKHRLRKIMLFTRVLAAMLLLIAIASPYVQTKKTIEGDPYLKLLVDNSSSMAVFENYAYELAKALEKKIPVEVKEVCSPERSDIGDAILANLEPYDSVLLFSDGNANAGASLGDVALYAASINSTINAMSLNAVQDDLSVIVLGPSKTQEGIENTFTVLVDGAGSIKEYQLTVEMDDQVIYDELTSESLVKLTRTIGKGYHKMTAKINVDDFYPQNNIYYKTVKVVPKPRVLYVTEEASPMKTLLDQLYIVDSSTSLTGNLDDYYTIAINDITAERMDPVADVLTSYVADGNGLVVIGGQNSFEKGGYRNSVFESMLPVYVSSPGKKEGEINIIIIIDISGSTSAAFGKDSTVDVEKALAIGVYHDLAPNNRLGVIAFNTEAYLVSPPSYVFEKQDLENRIARLSDGGGTLISAGLLKAVGILGEMQGSNNIILISDGKTQAEVNALEAARYAANTGIKIYTVGVGPTTNEAAMQQIAEITNGIYFRATESSRLKILFGDVEDERESNKMGVIVLNPNHYISSGLEPKALVYGFNMVVPKSSARMLLTTSAGDPLLAVWRLGLGRIAALSTDDGAEWAGELLGSENSNVISRIFNWAIGDPDRKSKEYIEAKDTRILEPTEIVVKSENPPVSKENSFYKIGENLYATTITPASIGFQTILDAVFAVNYAAEYEAVGMNPELTSIVQGTGGKIFKKEQVDDIVEQIKTRAKREIIKKDNIRWPFVLAAVILVLIEIFIRRLIRKEQ